MTRSSASGSFVLTGLGATGEVASWLISATGAGAVVGAPAAVVSAGVALGGMGNIDAGWTNLTQKHASRPGSWLAEYVSGGNHVANTAIGQRLIQEILDAGTVSTRVHPTFGNVVRVRMGDGRGVWFTEAGEFIGFLERYTPR